MNEKTKTIAVSCKKINKTFKNNGNKVVALNGIDLDVYTGELLMLVGPSGSGKTTLISVIAGILDQTEGDCSIFGTNLNHLSEEEKTIYRGKTIGFIFQNYNLIPMLTAQENVSIPLIIQEHNHIDSMKKAEETLSKLGLRHKIYRYPTQLSGGEQQRVAIARSVIHNPRLIVCDEPTSALDHMTGRIVLQTLKDIVLQENRTIIVVSHDTRIFEFADRIAKMEDGKIISIE